MKNKCCIVFTKKMPKSVWELKNIKPTYVADDPIGPRTILDMLPNISFTKIKCKFSKKLL